MSRTVDIKHRDGFCTVLHCENIGEARVVMAVKGLLFIECLCKEHLAQYHQGV